jgi:predicted nucleic acid-binding protein
LFIHQRLYKLIIGFQKSILQTIELDDISLKLIDDICKAGHEKSGFPSFYDASYHALSIQYNCYFVTADKRHFTKTQQLGHILLLSDWEKIL